MSALEALLSRERLAVAAGLAAAVALSWGYVFAAAHDMQGAMDGLSAWMMGSWDARYALLTFGMWIAMMVGMMLPSATPAILLFQRVLRNSAQGQAPVARAYAFAAGYLLAWAGFSLGATALQWWLARAAFLSPMLVGTSQTFGAVLLVVAGLYQWTPQKQACLSKCRSPAAFLAQHFRPGTAGALVLGIRHGLHCVGCCWALMLLLFVGGVMNLLWIGAITVFVLLEKFAPVGVQGGKLSGTLLVLSGLSLLARAAN